MERQVLSAVARLSLAVVLGGALTAQAATPVQPASEGRAVELVVIGTTGLLVAGGYTLGAFLTGDQSSGYPLAIVGAVGAGGMLGSWLGLALNASQRRGPVTVGNVLLPLLAGVAGAVLGGVTAGFTAKDPGSGRTATHAIIIGVLLTDTLIAELIALTR